MNLRMREKEALESMDIRHFYLEKGEGEPLLLLHGNGESGEEFLNRRSKGKSESEKQ